MTSERDFGTSPHEPRQLLIPFLISVMVTIAVASAVAQQRSSPIEGYVIGPQDVLSITCIDDPAVSGKFVVQSDGLIQLHLIGSVKVAGLTAADVESLLKSRYKQEGYLANPRISVVVEVSKSQRVIIQGEVRSPGQFTLTSGMTLLELIAQAGSMTPTASGEILIVRNKDKDQQEFVKADLSQMQNGATDGAIRLRDGDLVIVSQADRAYVIGEVKSPSAYAVQRGTTLMQMLTLAGGPTPDAAIGRIKIIRTVNGKQVEIKNAKQSEIIKPGDTIVVPVRYF